MKFTPLFLCTGIIILGATRVSGSEQVVAPSDPLPPAAATTQQLHLLDQFDKNGDHQLDAAERKEALAYLAQHPETTPATAPGRPGSPLPDVVALESIKPGTKVTPAEVQIFPEKTLFDESVVRTIFIDFENADWEKELIDFARTDIDVPARVMIDGKSYPGVGIHFRDRDPAPMTSEGYKRALDLTIDRADPGQTIGGERRLRLLDAATDSTYLRTMLYMHVARQYLAAPRTNFVRVVINGENWGTYVDTQPFDDAFAKESFSETGGARWSVAPGGTLVFLGDKAEAYRENYHLETRDDPKDWAALIDLCRLLNTTPTNQIESALAPRLDIDNALRFLALENVLINQSGYGGTSGGYGLYLAKDGRFHFVPQDAENSFRLVEQSDYERGSRRSAPRDGDSKESGATAGGKGAGKDPVARALRKYNPNNFPHQNTTDLAMMLSYSFVNKADTDLDGKVTKDEWVSFGRTWFLVMDEDYVGKLSRDQFLVKFRNLLTPPSIADGKTKQTFGHDDAPAIIGRDFFNSLDRNHDGQITVDEVTDCFAQWFAEWSNPKTGVITEPDLRTAFDGLFSRTVFQADQSYIVKHDDTIAPGDLDDAHGHGRGHGHGGGGGGGGGNGIGIGPLRIGGGRGGHGGESRTLVTFSEELDPLNGLDDENKPLTRKLLAVPALRTRYLDYVRELTENWLTWSKLGPVAQKYHDLIAAGVEKESHKAGSYAHFVQKFDQDTNSGARDGDAASSLKSFVTERHDYLLKDDNVMGINTGP
jgi:spore coat protein CotH